MAIHRAICSDGVYLVMSFFASWNTGILQGYWEAKGCLLFNTPHFLFINVLYVGNRSELSLFFF